jgi:Mrp family chromosome partitioning ATPase
VAKNKEYLKDTNIEENLGVENDSEVKQHVPFAIVESYKTIRTNLMFLLPNDKCKRIIVSSSAIGEGKSTTAVNMAIAFAQTGSKVLLVDADMRRPSVYKKMKLSNKVGLSSILAGFSEIPETI